MRPPLRSFLTLSVLLASALSAFAEAKLTLQDGDRVLLIGDVLIERENNFGYLETKMRREFPGRNFAVRNLGYSGDSPLGASRASFDPVAKGVDSLKEQLAVVKPTVAVLGYGMAASLNELTYRKNDPVLNPDPARYGLDHSPAKFRREMLQLMDLITAASPGGKVRFVFVGPIQHEDLRASRPRLPDPAEHNAILAEYAKVLRELAAEKNAPFIAAEWQNTAGIKLAHGTDNGVHLNARGYRALATSFAQQLGWKVDATQWDKEDAAQASLREAILRKNALFFHRSRPANYTYIFGFRRGEQGRNAVEIPKFDPLVDKAEANAIGISAGKPSTLPPEPKSETQLKKLPSLPRPDFKLEPGLEITLFAENPLLEKPVHMNWDTLGRLWVATSNTYPQVNPDDLGAQMENNASKFGPSTGNDRIILLEDTNKDGIAESSRIIADKLLIPAGVAPDNRGGCFVGASTELLHLSKPGEDGLLSERRILFSGFGTEDTHHIIHSLHWGVDGRLYFHQTIYIHSHIETPWGLIRANSGAAFAYDPESERLEVHSKGLVNAWGQQEDLSGQTFLTSGADGNGISWGFPGAVLNATEGARRTISSISPGSYPKFCGLEIVQSPLFGAEWQGNAITNDFRAHRIVRFAFNDFTADAKPKSGYITKAQPDIVRTSDASFRPIGVAMGPDGGIYVADWTNPIINHGEVDFRDPRRDKQRGRIWRIAPAGSKPLAWQPLAGQTPAALLTKLTSPSRWEFEQARRELLLLDQATLQKALSGWAKDEVSRRHAAWLLSGRTDSLADLLGMLKSADPVTVQVALRELGKANRLVQPNDVGAIAATLKHANPRVQLEAHRALARVGTFAAADALLDGDRADHSLPRPRQSPCAARSLPRLGSGRNVRFGGCHPRQPPQQPGGQLPRLRRVDEPQRNRASLAQRGGRPAEPAQRPGSQVGSTREDRRSRGQRTAHPSPVQGTHHRCGRQRAMDRTHRQGGWCHRAHATLRPGDPSRRPPARRARAGRRRAGRRRPHPQRPSLRRTLRAGHAVPSRQPRPTSGGGSPQRGVEISGVRPRNRQAGRSRKGPGRPRLRLQSPP